MSKERALRPVCEAPLLGGGKTELFIIPPRKEKATDGVRLSLIYSGNKGNMRCGEAKRGAALLTSAWG